MNIPDGYPSVANLLMTVGACQEQIFDRVLLHHSVRFDVMNLQGRNILLAAEGAFRAKLLIDRLVLLYL